MNKHFDPSQEIQNPQLPNNDTIEITINSLKNANEESVKI